MTDLRYPIGKHAAPTEFTPELRTAFIQQIEQLPQLLAESVDGLTDAQLDTPYRPDGWTVRQVVHHIADSHMNAYIRTKLAATEIDPLIKPYDEKAWAQMTDSANGAAVTSLALIEALHHRWVTFLRSLNETEFRRTFRHPERGLMTIDSILSLYSWHGRHHTAHITSLRERMKW